jgi:hypothetical protein
MVTCYSYESPKYLKLKGRVAELSEVMGRLYVPDQVRSRIDAINIE